MKCIWVSYDDKEERTDVSMILEELVHGVCNG
mgnify:FL=1